MGRVVLRKGVEVPYYMYGFKLHTLLSSADANAWPSLKRSFSQDSSLMCCVHVTRFNLVPILISKLALFQVFSSALHNGSFVWGSVLILAIPATVSNVRNVWNFLTTL